MIGIAELEERIDHTAPILALRTDAFARTAWDAGRSEALLLERRTVAGVARALRTAIRSADAIAHDPASDVIVVALLDLKRATTDDAELAGSLAGRLARIERLTRSSLQVEAYGGWGLATPGWVRSAIDEAIVLGRLAQDREALSMRLHDLGTPISGIAAVLSALIDGKIDMIGHRQLVVGAQSEAFRLGRMIRNLIALERTQFVMAEGDIETAIRLACQTLATQADERGVTVVASTKPYLVRLDFDGLLSLFTNLIENAVKHGRAGGRVDIAVQCDEHECTVIVDDDGAGIAPALHEEVFRIGSRASTAKGSGFGLASVRALVHLAGGTVDIARSPLGGARFLVRLPPPFAVAARTSLPDVS